MSIGTLSLNINTHDLNYGALLHTWAFQYLLINKFKLKTEVIDYVTPQFENRILKYPWINSIKEKKYRDFFLEIIKSKKFVTRYNKFQGFIKNNIVVSSLHYNQKTLNESILPYDTIICESDVIWSTDFFRGAFDKTFFCALDSMQNMKKIIYAASMGNGDLDEKQAKELKLFVKDIVYLSCRESYAVDIVQRYTNEKVYHVLDPVLLLDEKDYENIIDVPIIKEPYLLLYLPVGYNKYLVEQAHLYAQKHNLVIIEVSNSLRSYCKHRIIRDAGIEEFLSLIKNAEAVFSDSFHAVCFSVIFHKEFYAFSRQTGKKIEDICNQLNLNNRFINSSFVEQRSVDYVNVDKILKDRRMDSLKFLETALIQYTK